MQGRHHTNRVVFQHAHGQRGTGPGEGVEVTGHGHGDQAHVDDAGLDCFVVRIVSIWLSFHCSPCACCSCCRGFPFDLFLATGKER